MKNELKFLAGLIIVSVAVLFSGCKKSDADFKTDKDVYSVGDTIDLTCTSKNVKSAYWELPDGSTVKGKTASYIIPKRSEKTISFTLYVASRMGKVSEFTKEVTITNGISPAAANGKVTFWASWTAGYQLNVYAESINTGMFYDGLITNTFANDPGCSTVGALNFLMEPGTYHVWADSPFATNVWSQTITVTPGGCISLKVYPGF